MGVITRGKAIPLGLSVEVFLPSNKWQEQKKATAPIVNAIILLRQKIIFISNKKNETIPRFNATCSRKRNSKT